MRCSRLRTRALLWSAAMAVCVPAAVFAADVFTNPGFETGDFTGWTLEEGQFLGGAVVADDVQVGSGAFAGRSNVRSGAFAAVPATGKSLGITQTVAVEPNTSYLLGGWISSGVSPGATGTFPTNVSLGDVAGNSASAWVQVPAGSTPADFIPFRRVYTTAPGQTSATFRFRSGGTASIDDLFLQPWVAPASSTGKTDLFLTRGDPAPGGADQIVQVNPSYLANGHMAADAFVSAGGTVLVIDALGDNPTVLRRGWTPPEGNGTVSSFAPRGINDLGTTLLNANVTTPSGASEAGIYLFRDGQMSNVMRVGQPAPGGGGAFSSRDASRLSASDGVAFYARAGTTADGIYMKPAGGSVIKIAREGDIVPGFGSLANLTDVFAINRHNQVAFEAGGIFLHDGVSLRAITGSSTPVEGGPVTGGFSTPALNDAGHLAFAGGNSFRDQAMYFYNGATIKTLVTAGSAAPGGGSYSKINPPVINNESQVAFIARLADGGSGVYRTSASGVTNLIARSGQPRPDSLSDTFVNFAPSDSSGTGLPPVSPAIAAGGQVAFVDYSNTTPYDSGIYLGDGIETIQVARWGHQSDGRILTEIKWDTQPTLLLNDFGQVGYTATFADGKQSSVLFTPTLHWRSANSGNWSDSGNWTVGLAPAAVHPLIIDSPNGVTIAGPAVDTIVKSLKVGAGNTFDLVAGANLTVTDGMTLNAGAFLRGSGTIAADVVSAGTIAPGNSAGTITVAGDLAQSGVLSLELLGENTFDQLIVTGDLDLSGDVFVLGGGGGGGGVDVGDTFDLIKAASITGSPTWHLPGESTFQIVNLPGGGQSVQVTYVPEPGAMALSVVVVVALCRRRRRRQI